MIYLILIVLINTLSLYFFIPVIFGAVAYLYGAKRFGAFFILLGVFGSMNGIPYHYDKVKYLYESKRHFSRVCEENAVVQLPNRPLFAEGVVWVNYEEAGKSFLSNKDGYADFIGPVRARYVALQMKSSNSTTYSSMKYVPSGRLDITGIDNATISSATLPFEVYTRQIATDEDKKYGVDGIETTITNSATKEVVAKRVVYAKYPPETNSWGKPLEMCPQPSMKDSDCSVNGCSVLPFVLSAVRPRVTEETKASFHLFRGVGEKLIGCSFEIGIGPGIKVEDIEWWSEKSGAADTLNLRIKRTNDHAFCTLIGSFPRNIYFFDSGKNISVAALFRDRNHGTRFQPRSLDETLRVMKNRVAGELENQGAPAAD